MATSLLDIIGGVQFRLIQLFFRIKAIETFVRVSQARATVLRVH